MGPESAEHPRPQPALSPTPDSHRVTRTRNRIPRSCQACRVRKLKCNREKPCQNCVVRGDAVAASCSYAAAAPTKPPVTKIVKSGSLDVRGRIERLQNLVMSLKSQDMMEPGSPQGPLPGQSDSEASFQQSPRGGRLGTEEIDAAERLTAIAGRTQSIDSRSTHWDAILHDITALKDAWGRSDEVRLDSPRVSTDVHHEHRPGLLNGLACPPDMTTLLASLPSKAAADQLLERFWAAYNPALPAASILHRPTFFKEYERHWKDPGKTKIIWLGLLFAVLSFAMQTYVTANEEPPQFEGSSKLLLELYRIRTAQCIVAADITRPRDYMLETVFLHSIVEYMHRENSEARMWLLSGLLLRVALQQGYHRDPSRFPELSPFKAEMRRRRWMLVSQHEVIFTVQLGLPRAIRYADCDTAMPRNLHEHELYEDMKELPPSNPMTEPTWIGYQIAKGWIICAFGQVVEYLHSLEDQPYDTVMRLDAALIRAKEMVPPHLVFESIADESPGAIMEKYILQHFYHKGICLLHRKYLTTSLDDDKYAYSRRACINSALTLLHNQAYLHKECQPGGRLPHSRWYQLSLLSHDFLLAVMLVCLAMYNITRRRSESGASQAEYSLPSRQDEMLAAIQQARSIWAQVADESPDARRATNILTVISEKLGIPKYHDSRVPTFSNYHITPSSSGRGSMTESRMLPMVNRPSDSTNTTAVASPWCAGPYLPASAPASEQPGPHSAYDSGNSTIYENLFASGRIFHSFEQQQNVPYEVDWGAWDSYVNGLNRADMQHDPLWPREAAFVGAQSMAPTPNWT